MSTTFETRSASGVAPQAAPPNRPVHLRMTAEQWFCVQDNPRQRDTERRLARATHLYTDSPAHAHVFMAVTYDGKTRWKLDGHTRALLWSKRPELAPNSVYVTCLYVENADEAAELYGQFDSPQAVETAQDRVAGSYHQMGWRPQSPYLADKITSAMRLVDALATGYTTWSGKTATKSIYDVIAEWQSELALLDTIKPTSKRFSTAILAAALLTLRRRGPKALPFWDLFQRDQGIKLENQMDAVEMMNRMRLLPTKNQNTVIAARVVSCFEHWRSGQLYNIARNGTGPKTRDLLAYLGTKRETRKDHLLPTD